MGNQSYTYVEADSSLYGPDGTFLKQIYCPKAVGWNQLIADDPEDRSRGCNYCDERVLNLDVLGVREAVQTLMDHPFSCVFGSEKSVRFLRDPKRPDPLECVGDRSGEEIKPVVIQTVRSELDINRGAASGFWPDIRLITYKSEELKTKRQVMQNSQTGRIILWGDYRSTIEGDWWMEGSIDDWAVVIPWTTYYQHYQNEPFAAYLVPKGLPAGTPVVIPDPIEDIVGEVWNQGDVAKASDVTGVWDGQRIILNVSQVTVSYVVG